MILRELEEPIFVEDADAFEGMLQQLEGCGVLAVDCEMDSFWSYWGRVCLIQLSDGELDWIVDPSAVDLTGLGPIMANPAVVKIFHDAEYDVRQMRRDFGFDFAGLFDTRAAAAICGVQAPGLGSLLEKLFGVVVDKKYQRADWSKRPLSEEMLTYAQADVAYLHPLRLHYVKALEEIGRMEILRTEHRRLESTPASADPYPVDNYARLKGANKLNGVERRRLRELFRTRNEIAASEDRAPFRLMSNDALLALSQKPITSAAEFRNVRGINRHAYSRLAGPMVTALKEAGEMNPIERHPSKQKVKLKGRDRDRFERIRKLRARVARELNVDGSLLLRKELAVQLAQAPPPDLESLASHLEDWQLGLYGVDLISVLQS